MSTRILKRVDNVRTDTDAADGPCVIVKKSSLRITPPGIAKLRSGNIHAEVIIGMSQDLATEPVTNLIYLDPSGKKINDAGDCNSSSIYGKLKANSVYEFGEGETLEVDSVNETDPTRPKIKRTVTAFPLYQVGAPRPVATDVSTQGGAAPAAATPAVASTSPSVPHAAETTQDASTVPATAPEAAVATEPAEAAAAPAGTGTDWFNQP